jgi:hypothetical protein
MLYILSFEQEPALVSVIFEEQEAHIRAMKVGWRARRSGVQPIGNRQKRPRKRLVVGAAPLTGL